MDYTVIGDTVNSTQRIEELTKKWPNSILVSESTYLYVKDLGTFEKIEQEQLRGKKKLLDIYRFIESKKEEVSS